MNSFYNLFERRNAPSGLNIFDGGIGNQKNDGGMRG